MSQDNREIVRRWFEEVWNQRRAETIDEFITPESVCFTEDGPLRGPEEFRQRQFLPLVGAFPDLHIEIKDIVAEDDNVVVRWIATGTHAGAALGFEATNAPADFAGISWIRVRDGKFGEGWQNSNMTNEVRRLAAMAPA